LLLCILALDDTETQEHAAVMMWQEVYRICSGGGGQRTTEVSEDKEATVLDEERDEPEEPEELHFHDATERLSSRTNSLTF
jgi:hypothetical protein